MPDKLPEKEAEVIVNPADEIIDYVMNSPQNTNRAVLTSIVNKVLSESGGSVSQNTLIGERNASDITANIGDRVLVITAKKSVTATILIYNSITDVYEEAPVFRTIGEDTSKYYYYIYMPGTWATKISVELVN